jgi:hypothetical protein
MATVYRNFVNTVPVNKSSLIIGFKLQLRQALVLRHSCVRKDVNKKLYSPKKSKVLNSDKPPRGR